MSSPVNELSQNTNASELSNLLSSNKFSIYAVKSYDIKVDGVTDDYAKLAALITIVDTAGGGIIDIPKGTLLLSTGIVLPPYVQLRGSGNGTTVIKYTGIGTAITCNDDGTTLGYGITIRDLGIQLVDKASIGIKLYGTCGFQGANINIEGLYQPFDNTRTNIGVVIDGADISSFFNTLTNVYSLHVHTGFKLTKSGTVEPTATNFINCQSYGDVATDNESIGFYFDNSSGNGSVIIGGNVESCSVGIKGIGTSVACGSFTALGLRFEGNTEDINIGTYTTGVSLIGCINLDTYTMSLQDGYGGNNIINCVKTDGTILNLLETDFILYSKGTGGVPLVVQGYPSQTSAIFKIKNSVGDDGFCIDPVGKITRINGVDITISNGTGSPENQINAIVGSIYTRRDGGANTTLYIKESGTGNTGWVAK